VLGCAALSAALSGYVSVIKQLALVKTAVLVRCAGVHGRGAGGGAVCGGGAGARGQPADALAGRARRCHAVRQGKLPLQAQQRKDVRRHTTTTCHCVCNHAMCVSSLPGPALRGPARKHLGHIGSPQRTAMHSRLCRCHLDTVAPASTSGIITGSPISRLMLDQSSAKGDNAWQMTACANEDLHCCRAGGGRLLHPGLQPHRADRAAGLWHCAHQLRLQAAGVNLLWRWWRPAAAAVVAATGGGGGGSTQVSGQQGGGRGAARES